MAKAAAPKPLCCVSIGYQDLLMPATEGMKLVELLRHAVECNRSYDRRETFVVSEKELDVRYCSVSANQVVMPAQPGREFPGLPHEPAKIGAR
jgi:hypothetical protein